MARLPDHLIIVLAADAPARFIVCDLCDHRAATHATLNLTVYRWGPGIHLFLCDEHAPAHARKLERQGQSVAVPAEWPADWRTLPADAAEPRDR